MSDLSINEYQRLKNTQKFEYDVNDSYLIRIKDAMDNASNQDAIDTLNELIMHNQPIVLDCADYERVTSSLADIQKESSDWHDQTACEITILRLRIKKSQLEDAFYVSKFGNGVNL